MKKYLKLAAVLCVLGAGVAGAEAAPENIAIVGDHSSVCMVTDQYMGEPQIPVQKDGKTYYGCCKGCAGQIKNDATIRHSTDPVTGAQVDKAKAVIAKDDTGKVYYFESEKTYRMFAEKAGK